MSCDHHMITVMIASSPTSSMVHLPPVEESSAVDHTEPPADVVTVTTNKAKEEQLTDSVGSSSTVDYNSHVSLSGGCSQSSQPAPHAWNKGMKILLGCKVSHWIM